MLNDHKFNSLCRRILIAMCLLLCVLVTVKGEAFGAQQYLSMTYIGEGSTNPPVGVHDYSQDSLVTITATPAAGWYFDHWEGHLTGSTNPAELTMNGNKRVSAVFVPFQPTAENALARYVGKLDPNYSWYEDSSEEGWGWTKYTLRMTSQQWRNLGEVDRVLWEHDLGIIKPWFINTDQVLLLVNGGDNGKPPQDIISEIGFASLALGMNYAQLDQIPNQPLKFTDDNTNDRKEDEILAYSLDKALITGDMEWIAHMAMTKAAVRAMDAVQEKLGNVEDFLVTGASKRGWTTYLTSAIDPRVKAMLPISIDIANISENMKHHWEAYGFYAPAVHDYADYDLFCRMQDPAEPYAADVLKIVDPLTYFAKYTMPKLILVSAGDQFFLPDSSRFYYSDLPAAKNLRYTVNTDHSQLQAIVQLLSSALFWADKAMNNKALPEFNWTFEPDGSIRVQTQTTPRAVRLWQAHNPDARDFRLETIGAAWAKSPLTDQGGGVYIGYVPAPQTGWTAFLVELDFDDAITLTTEVAVTPDTLPFEGTHCSGSGRVSPRLVSGDLAGGGCDNLIYLNEFGQIFYDVALLTWNQIPGAFSYTNTGDLNGDGKDDIVGLTSSGQIYYTLDLSNWSWLPGILSQLTIGDFNGDGLNDLAGVTSSGQIYYTLDRSNWQWMPGILDKVTAGDLNGDGKDDLAGLTASGQIYYTLDLSSWQHLPGTLSQMSAGEIDGDGKDDLIGVISGGQIYYTTDLSSWAFMPGILDQVATYNCGSSNWIAGLTGTGDIYVTYDRWNWVHISGP